MAGMSDTLENSILDLVFRAVAYTGASTLYVKLHIGDPTDAGTGSPAADTRRISCTFVAASAGATSNVAAITWTSMTANETISHISIWDTVGPSGGVMKWSGALTTPKAVAIGDDFTIAIGDLDITLD